MFYKLRKFSLMILMLELIFSAVTLKSSDRLVGV